METRWSPMALRFFEAFFRPYRKRRLAGVYLQGGLPDFPSDACVVMVANHVSWWDAFLLREVHRLCADRKPIYTLMLEEQLRKYWFFRLLGVLGLEPQNKASLLKVTRWLMNRRRTDGAFWLMLFPQGRIWPSSVRPLNFKEGVRLFAKVLRPAFILPVGLHVEMLNQPTPSAFVSVGDPIEVVEEALPACEEIEARVVEALERTQKLLRVHGEDITRHWPGIEV